MGNGTLIEFGGLPGTGKSTLARRVAGQTGAVLLRIDEIEAAMWRNGLTPQQTGVAAYSIAHDLAASHLRRGLTVVADAVSPVGEARDGWRELARSCAARHVVIEIECPDPVEHRRRIEARIAGVAGDGALGDGDLPGFAYPDWRQLRQRADAYQPRTDPRLVVDTTRPIDECHRQIARHLAIQPVVPGFSSTSGSQTGQPAVTQTESSGASGEQ